MFTENTMDLLTEAYILQKMKELHISPILMTNEKVRAIVCELGIEIDTESAKYLRLTVMAQ